LLAIDASCAMQDFKKLRVWHAAHRLCLQVIEALPEEACNHVTGLRGQAIRAATSVEWNIAEGSKRSSRKDFLGYLDTALSSLGELEAQIITARDANVITLDTYDDLQISITVVRRMLISLMRTVQRHIADDEEAARERKKLSRSRPNESRAG